MTRQELLAKLKEARAGFDQRLAAVPVERLTDPVPGSAHSVRDIVVHVAGYDQLIVERLMAAGHGAMTALDRDRAGWEAFNERIWREAAKVDPKQALRQAADAFQALLHEVGNLSDDELNERIGSTAALDPAWLDGRAPWELIAIDAYEHYPMHYAALEAAARAE